METRHGVLALVLVVTALMLGRGLVALTRGDVGTVGRQLGVGAVLLVFGLALVARWDEIG
jgi:hypothetical protein